MQPPFTLGQTVRYKGNVGKISFIDPIYVTVCTNIHGERSLRDVCLVVYAQEWNLLTPVVVDCNEIQRRGC